MSESPARVAPLSYLQILVFWLPLGLMWLMMAAEQPALTAVIARMKDAEINLAAFGVVFAISLVIESPIIQMLGAATAVADSEANYRMLMRFMHVLGAGLTALHLILGLTPLYDLVVGGVLNVPGDVLEASRFPFVLMAPFTMAVGYRRLWQGVLIRHGKTWIVPITMVSRLAVVAVVLWVGLMSDRVAGAVLASIAIAAGVIVAAVAAGLLNMRLVLPVLRARKPSTPYSWRSLFRFYAPLSMTTVIFLLSQPMVTFGMARGLEPTRSLAVFPVVNGLLFLFASVGMSYQEAAIALLNRSPHNRARLSRFTLVLAVSISGLALVTGLTPVGTWWFQVVSGLSPSLLPLVRLPLLFLSVVPALLAYKAWYRAQYVTAGRTTVLAQAVMVYTVSLFILVFLGSTIAQVAGVVVAAVALSLAQAAENGYLLGRRRVIGPAPRVAAAGGVDAS